MTRQSRELKVVLDTNVIYNVSGDELVKSEVGSLIKASFSHLDLVITWYLPEVVKNEREHQLRELARKSLPAIQNLERVLGFTFGLTDQMIVDRVRKRINDQIDHLQVRILKVNPAEVDWNKLMEDAAFRHPPFARGEREKGFRDAVIVEAVGQLVESCSDCRLAVVTGDELMTRAIITKTSSAQNLHVLSSIEELKGLIDTLVANVDESFIDQMKTAAASFFFEQGDRQSYLYQQNIKERILREFHSLIYEVPVDTNEVERGKALVSRPRFKKKVDDRMYWVSRIAFRMKAYKDEASSTIVTAPLPQFGYSGYSGYSEFAGYSAITDDSSTSDIESSELSTSVIRLGPPAYKLSRLPTKIGYVAFDVTWSITVKPLHELTDPNIESIDHVETSWE